MVEETFIEQAKVAIRNLGKKRALVRMEESEEGIAIHVFDTQNNAERLIVLENHPYSLPDWACAEKLLALMMGYRRSSDKNECPYEVERLPLAHQQASGEK